ncbi:unnamed protein product [Nezara viridula]|uniref:Uncharacterized protein n=1 Tax=Nezara viridula TaxID=85310 RepID=A0A9P0HPB7_NEZVI|nr:unnamed protein product [Nezara viridula]
MLLLGYLIKEASELNEELAIKKLERLSSLAELADEIYGPIILLSATNCFGSALINLYVLLANLYIGNIIVMIIVIGWVGISVTNLLSIVYSSGIFNKQIHKFNEELRMKIMSDETQEYSENEILNFHLFAYKATEFTACGFFNIDYTVISSVIEVAWENICTSETVSDSGQTADYLNDGIQRGAPGYLPHAKDIGYLSIRQSVQAL